MTVVDLTDASGTSRLGQRTAALAAWTGAALLMAVILHIQTGLLFLWGLVSSLVYYYILAVLMIPAARVSRKLGDAAIPTWRHGLAHLAMALVVIALWQGFYALSLRLMIGPSFWGQAFAQSWLFQLIFAFLIYGLAVSVVVFQQARQRERLRERREAELRLTAREAELTAIRAQLQPHFLLNALNSILALIEAEPARARTMVVRLADLLRTVFAASETPEASLREEIALVRAYLEIESVRFGKRLFVTDAVEERALAALVPTLLLQPLVENAVKHGIAPFPEGGRIHIAAEVTGTRLRLSVRNSTGGAERNGGAESGRGLELTRRRLAAAYGDDHQLSIQRSAGNFVVSIDLPARFHAV